MESKNDEIEIDLREIFQLLLAKLGIILLVAFVFAGATGLICKFMVTPIYSSQTELCILSDTTTLSSLADLQVGTQLTQDYIVVVQSRTVVEQVIKNLNLDMTYEQLLGVTTVTNPTDTRILKISVTNPDPYLAKQIVDQYAQVSRKRIAQLMNISEPGIVDQGYVDDQKTSPKTGKNVVIAFLIGALLTSGIVIVRFIMDDTICSSSDIERYLGLNTLGVLPVEETAIREENREKNETRMRKKKYQQKKKWNKTGGEE
jgi:capsular polysaccharide biosynthesis protein